MLFRAGRHPFVWVLVAAFVCLFATTGFAQAVVDPVTAEFDPSADHNALSSSGAPLVDSYLLAFYAVGGTTPVQTINLGKPTPASDGKIRVDFTTLVSSLPPAGVTYEARVSAVGGGGSAASSVSNQFSFSAACDPAIGSPGLSMTSAAGSGSVSVAAGAGCAWTAASSASWLTVTSGASGTGNGTVSFSVSANTGASMRTATLAIGGETFTVSQAGTSCTYTISPTSQTVAAAGATGTITVTTTAGCAWAATTNTSWLTISSGATGTGNGSVGFSALANSLSTARTGTIIAAGKTFTVTQSASTCTFTVSPTTVLVASSATTSSVNVTTATGCAWSATETSTWLSITSGTGRTGSGSLSFSATANTGATRGATMTVAGKPVTVSQSGVSTAAITVSPSTLNIGKSSKGSTTAQQITISQGAGSPVSWTVTTSQTWLQASPTSGSGAKLVSISLTPGVALPTATTSATVTVTPSSGTAKTVQVNFKVNTGASAVPFGIIETPVDNTGGVTGSIPVTGWALDDIDIARVRVLRDPVAGEGSALIFIGNAVLVEGARPDVAAVYPTLPHNTRAGWGYLMLTNMLPNQGNGTFKLSAYADDVEGYSVLLGSKTITCTNSTATAPFGAIDTPGQGETVSGTTYNNFGWVLSRGTRHADPPGGGNVRVVIDGAFLGSPAGWTSRSDLSALFPVSQYSGVTKALGVYGFNTTTLANGPHTIAWVVTDNLGVSAGVGSRYFSVLNGGGLFAGLSAEPASASESLVIAAPDSTATAEEISASAALASVDSTPILARRGYAEETPFRHLRADESGLVTVQAEEMDRIELALSETSGERCTGYSVTGGVNAPLPVGSSLDPTTCVFTWQAGIGFVGSYDFVFVRESSSQTAARNDVRVVLNAKRSGLVGPQVVIDIPGAHQVVGRPFVVAGWAADLDADISTGVDTLHVWAYPAGGEPIFLGVASYGGTRPDVAAFYGNQFRATGYGLEVSDLPAGTYDLAVFAWSTVTGGFVPASTVRVTVK